GRALSPWDRNRFSAVVLEDWLRAARGRTSRDGVSRPITVGARTLYREIARARRARFGRLALRPVFAALRANVARRGRRRLVWLHVLRHGGKRCRQADDQQGTCHKTSK